MSQFLSPGQMWKPGTGPNPGDGDFNSSTLREDQLINHRLTWLIASQSLLFAGYAVLLAADKSHVSSDAAWSAIVTWMPRLGIVIATLILLAIASSVLSSWLLRRSFNFGTSKLRTVTTWAGWAPALLLPVVFIVVWSRVSAPTETPRLTETPVQAVPAVEEQGVPADAPGAKDKRRGKRTGTAKKATAARYAGDLPQ
jgi:hypothetical protein